MGIFWIDGKRPYFRIGNILYYVLDDSSNNGFVAVIEITIMTEDANFLGRFSFDVALLCWLGGQVALFGMWSRRFQGCLTRIIHELGMDTDESPEIGRGKTLGEGFAVPKGSAHCADRACRKRAVERIGTSFQSS